MIRRFKIGRAHIGIAVGSREGRRNPANRNAPRVVHGPGGRTFWWAYGRAWVVITPADGESGGDAT